MVYAHLEVPGENGVHGAGVEVHGEGAPAAAKRGTAHESPAPLPPTATSTLSTRAGAGERACARSSHCGPLPRVTAVVEPEVEPLPPAATTSGVGGAAGWVEVRSVIRTPVCGRAAGWVEGGGGG
jgi:hypothetical protein